MAPGGALGHGGPRASRRHRQVKVVIALEFRPFGRLAQPGPAAWPWYLPPME